MITVPATRRLAASLIAGGATALVTHLATLFVFFVGNGFDASVIGVANGFFGFSSLFVFVLVAAGAYLTEFSRWYLTLLVGVLAAVVGAFLGTFLGAVLAGSPFGGDLGSGVLASLGGVNLSFEVAALVSTLALAPRGYDLWLSSRPSRVRSGKIALVRLPSRTLAAGAVTNIERSEVDTEVADDQWAAYVDALRGEGWSIVEVPLADGLADSVFVEDAVVIVGDLAILARSGAEHRRDEVDDVEATVRRLGLSIARITEPATLDGGDVLQVGDTVYVGRGGRTNADGIRQLRDLLRPTGRQVVAVPVSGALHLKSVVTALPDGTVLGHGDFVDSSLFPHYLPVPEAEGSQIVVLGDDVVLISDAAPASADLIRSLGYRVIAVPISEFTKLEAGVTCLSVRIA
ncbi:dimethylargininase [Herbiconiux sp. L3-i23]|uniref:dimethylargininase n=1 Tax=Herbiconiux sp. L3-i23 TaxID=2905871 RepID=UPI00206284C7|nr:dimethylargininase [Herbiconiux sp. L3-i23]BDI23796.1 hypothetical protein L3i23_25720 [Herbiconiux sp. L3-i23]